MSHFLVHIGLYTRVYKVSFVYIVCVEFEKEKGRQIADPLPR